MKRAFCLTVAGFDPSSGAGLSADLKTFEALGVYGLAVQTALTIQNESVFKSVHWSEWEWIRDQIAILAERYPVKVAKIGLIENLEILNRVLRLLHEKFSGIKLIWDPILRASAGFEFHEDWEKGLLPSVFSELELVTPNRDEIASLYPEDESAEAEFVADELSHQVAVLLKGGHQKSENATDILFRNGKARYFTSERLPHPKHGSGCVLSAATAAHLALGRDLPDAVRLAKDYVQEFLGSSEGRLGHHQAQVPNSK